MYQYFCFCFLANYSARQLFRNVFIRKAIDSDDPPTIHQPLAEAPHEAVYSLATQSLALVMVDTRMSIYMLCTSTYACNAHRLRTRDSK